MKSALALLCCILFSFSLSAQVPEGVTVAPGFKLEVYCDSIVAPRTITVTDNGLILVTSRSNPQIYSLPSPTGDGKIQTPSLVLDNVHDIHGIVSRGKDVWLGQSGRILHFTLDANNQAGLVDTLVDNLPSGGAHPTRMLALGPDNRLYTMIGSSSNIAEDLQTPLSQKRQKIWSYKLDGTDEQLFCVGLRNTQKVEWNPVTHQMWGTDHGSDNISPDHVINDDNPTCEFNLLEKGVDYGNPYIVTDQYGKNMIRPEFATRPDIQDRLKNARPSAIVLGGHVAPTGFTFYRGDKFPAIYRNSAFICMHGSWNRTIKNGYRVDAAIFKDGMPSQLQTIVSFLSEDRSQAYGRPVDAVTAPDGSLLFTDDTGNKVYRLSYVGSN